ncbi:MAG: hypothetical protein P1U36_08820 [Legionellaceae bacterium]|nr:hypothetical protein [Legionellaceae bacterium]
MRLSSTIRKKLGLHPRCFLEHDADTLQTTLASSLRQQAIQHLRQSEDVVAKSFRGEYIRSGLGYPHTFLDAQAKNHTWGTYLEATALGEQLGCNIIVTPVKKGVHQKPICLYRAEDKNAKTIHLYNSNNTHWYIDNKTRGDGNCLYNAFAQALQQHVQAENPQPQTPKQSHAGLFQIKRDLAQSLEQQKHLLESIQKQQTPEEREVMFNQELARINQLSPQEKQQIQDDHMLALQLAYHDMGYAHANPTSLKAVLEEISEEQNFIAYQ